MEANMRYLSNLGSCRACAISKIHQRSHGFTLLELLVVLAIIGISTSLAVPNFYPLLKSYQIASTADALERNLHQARHEAVLNNHRAAICASADGRHCAPDQDWSHGFISYIDINQDGEKQNTEELINSHIITRSIRVTFNRQQGLNFNGLGRSSMNGTFSICDPNERSHGQRLTLIHSGRIRKSNASNTCN